MTSVASRYTSCSELLNSCTPQTLPFLAYKSDKQSLISADRNNKATLLLTILRCTTQSYAKDLSEHDINCNEGRVGHFPDFTLAPYGQW